MSREGWMSQARCTTVSASRKCCSRSSREMSALAQVVFGQTIAGVRRAIGVVLREPLVVQSGADGHQRAIELDVGRHVSLFTPPRAPLFRLRLLGYIRGHMTNAWLPPLIRQLGRDRLGLGAAARSRV